MQRPVCCARYGSVLVQNNIVLINYQSLCATNIHNNRKTIS